VKTIKEALGDIATYPTSITIDYLDRAGERGSAHYSGIEALTRAEGGLETLRGRHSTDIVVAGRWADGTRRRIEVL
jgi:hypothetical protein